MISRRLVAAAGGVTALLVVAGIASHGRPLAGGGGGSGPSPTFFDYIATTLFIAAAAMVALVVWAFAAQPRSLIRPRPRRQWHILSTLLSLAAAAVLGAFILRHTDLTDRLRAATSGNGDQQSARQVPGANDRGRDPRVRWDEVAIVLVLVGGTVLVLLANRRRSLPRTWTRRGQTVSVALDESIDDLRMDPDLRRAIVAAYARMERALAASGLARHPAEAPFEYMERALTSLDASADAAERLTALFEWAKFSHHEPGPAMRDEAIDALVAVRDELRRPAQEAVVS